MKSPQRIERLSRALRHTQHDLAVVLENIHDPHNVSAILRTCDAVGVRNVSLVYTTESFPKIGRKSSASANKWVTGTHYKSLSDCYKALSNEGFTIAASALTEDSSALYDIDLTRKTALVFGNEHRGVSDEAVSLSDIRFKIPMYGMIQSLNVSVAAAVTLYEALRQRVASGDFFTSRMQEKEFMAMLEQWLKK